MSLKSWRAATTGPSVSQACRRIWSGARSIKNIEPYANRTAAASRFVGSAAVAACTNTSAIKNVCLCAQLMFH